MRTLENGNGLVALFIGRENVAQSRRADTTLWRSAVFVRWCIVAGYSRRRMINAPAMMHATATMASPIMPVVGNEAAADTSMCAGDTSSALVGTRAADMACAARLLVLTCRT